MSKSEGWGDILVLSGWVPKVRGWESGQHRALTPRLGRAGVAYEACCGNGGPFAAGMRPLKAFHAPNTHCASHTQVPDFPSRHPPAQEVLLPKKSAPVASTAAPMKAALSLLLPCVLAEVWLVPGLAPGPLSPEAQAEPGTPQTLTAQNETTKEVQPPEKGEPWLAGSGWQLSEETSNLGFSLLRKISMRHEGNVLFSPLGLSLAITALMLGAKGQTKAQLESRLRPQAQNQTRPGHLPTLFGQLRTHLSRNRDLGLTQGSWAFIHQDFDVNETFLNLSKRYFDTECVTMNFRNASQAQGLMNHYINKKTQGKIPKLFDEVNPDTKLILVDYILFQGNWLTPFDPAFTEVNTFHLDKYKTVQVPMMYRAGNFASTFDKNFRCHILKLPYQGNATMLVVLMEKMGDHFALEDYLSTDLVDTWLRNMKTRNMEVFFPKFKLDQKYEMHKLLKQMRVTRIFSRWADLGELSTTAINLKVSKILQGAVMEVNEKGTAAAAGTLSEIIAYSMPPIIKVDRPFHFMIYEETSRMLLFLGRVVNPAVL